MAGPVYSTRFLVNSAPGVGTYTYVVPAGYRAILRDVDAICGAPVSGLILAIEVAGAVIHWWVGNGAAVQSHQWTGRQVVNAGESLALYIATANCAFAVSGYLLLL